MAYRPPISTSLPGQKYVMAERLFFIRVFHNYDTIVTRQHIVDIRFVCTWCGLEIHNLVAYSTEITTVCQWQYGYTAHTKTVAYKSRVYTRYIYSPNTSCIQLYPLSPSTCILYLQQNCRWRGFTATSRPSTCIHLYPDTSCSSEILVSGYMYHV